MCVSAVEPDSSGGLSVSCVIFLLLYGHSLFSLSKRRHIEQEKRYEGPHEKNTPGTLLGSASTRARGKGAEDGEEMGRRQEAGGGGGGRRAGGGEGEDGRG